MKIARKVGCLLLCASLVGSLAVGCNKPAEPVATEAPKTEAPTKTEEPKQGDTAKPSGKITWSSNRTDLEGTVLKAYKEEFEKANPGTEIAIETIKDYQKTIKIKMASNQVPDVWTVHNGEYSQETLAKFNVALDDKFDFAKDFTFTDPFKGADGKIYAVPTGASYTGVVYNKKLFAELKLTVPTKLSDFIATAKKINEAGKVGLATASKDSWPLQYYWLDVPKMIAGDSTVLNKAAEADEPFTKDSAIYKSYELLKKFADEKILEKDPLSAGWEPAKKDFRDGKVGMFLLGPWFVPQAIGGALTMDDVGFFPLPYDDNGGKNVVGGPDVAVAIAKDSKNAALSEAFFKFLTVDKYAAYAKEVGLLSAKKGVDVDLPFAKEFMSYNPVILPAVGDSQALQDRMSAAKFDFKQFAQEVVGGKNVDTLFKDLNAKWKKAAKK